jgi:hypothetical protein
VIDFINVANLSNKVVGYGAENRGRMAIPGIIAVYGTEPIEIKDNSQWSW